MKILVGGALLAAAGPAIASTLHVDDDAPAGGSGSSWATAMPSLQDALVAAARDGDVTEIKVAAGVYRPDVGKVRRAGDRTESFYLQSGLALRGGYAGFGAPDPDARDIAGFETILSGDLLGDDGPGFANTAENSYHVVVALSVDDTAVLEGFTVTGGFADGPNFGPSPESKDQGSAVNVYYAQPRLEECTFRSNWAINHGTVNDHGDTTLVACTFMDNHTENLGAGLYSHIHAATSATGCVFIGNSTVGHGGGAYNRGSTTAVLTGCHFEGNTATHGGGFYGNTDSGTTLVGCTFTGNTAETKGGGLYGDHGTTSVLECTFTANDVGNGEGGGGIWFEGGDPTVSGCTFVANTAVAGGGLYNKLGRADVSGCVFTANVAHDGAALWNEGVDVSISNCTFTQNEGATGAGIYNENTAAVIVGCSFSGNVASDGDGGGGITNAFGSIPVIVGCSFVDNVANAGLFGGGGGMANYISTPRVIDCDFVRNSADLGGGAMYNELFDGVELPDILGCVFTGNTASNGGAIQNFRAGPRLANCIFAGNVAMGEGIDGFGGGIDNQFLSAPTVTNCTFAANVASAGGALTARDSSMPVLENTIIWGNGPEPVAVGPFGSVVAATYSCIEGGFEGAGNVGVDPLFQTAPSPGTDGAWGTDDDEYGDLRLDAASPVIDAGTNGAVAPDAFDLDADGDRWERTPVDVAGAPRFQDGPAAETGCGVGPRVDMGAHEADGAPGTVRVGDLDADGAVTAADVALLLGAWGACPDPCCPADLDGDGVVTFRDLLRALAAWGG